MKIRSNSKIEEQKILNLVLPAIDGTSAWEFSMDLIDAMRQIVTRITRTNELPSRFAVVSAVRGEGVTTIARALSMAIAHDLGVKTCLVELNWWWPSDTALVASDNDGLAAVINQDSSLEEIIAPTGWTNFAYLPAGELLMENRPIIARSQALRNTLDLLNERYDHIILDVPAILATSDAIPLASLAPACCLVVRQGVTNVNLVKQALDEIDHLNILGVILNQSIMYTPRPLLNVIPMS